MTELVVEDGADEARRDHHRARRGEGVLQSTRIFGAGFQIDHRVRNAVARGVDLLKNVAVLRAEEGGDLTEGAGFVLIDDAETGTGGCLLYTSPSPRDRG